MASLLVLVCLTFGVDDMVKFPLRMSGHIVGDGVIHMTDSHFAGVFSDLDNDDWIAVYMTPDGFTRYSAKAEPD